jgi:hypothetical protein
MKRTRIAKNGCRDSAGDAWIFPIVSLSMGLLRRKYIECRCRLGLWHWLGCMYMLEMIGFWGILRLLELGDAWNVSFTFIDH